jgi:polysaccharide export outer membrane protein
VSVIAANGRCRVFTVAAVFVVSLATSVAAQVSEQVPLPTPIAVVPTEAAPAPNGVANTTSQAAAVPSLPPAKANEVAKTRPVAPTPVVPTGVALPPGYVIGTDDVLTVVFWKDKDMTSDVAVRPDGKITLPLVNDVEAAGLTPEQLRGRITEGAAKFIEDPTVTVVVKQINSRKVFITGMVKKPGVYPLTSPITVLQFITVAGGVVEFAKDKEIMIMRTENGVQKAFKFNYREVQKGKNLKQNIELRPGDTVIVP